MMFKTIEVPAICEICLVIGFLNARNMRRVEIHRQTYEVYGDSVTSERMVENGFDFSI